ncbi:helix-turn-helix transcriptional regulator [Arthrobacter echini]|uniref:Helix-turn-helix transcriptional regulator n=1 Tax=Arthrobacter echini TaxID=1529066 RepID=A0A5D0XR63_9MICC|nr:helix-turn-helix transcriptional regulator [Arthrobacter echini]
MFSRLTETRGHDAVNADRLTAHEVEVRELLAEGLADKRIATRFAISVETAEKHVGAMLRETGARNRTMLVGVRRPSSAYVLRRRQHARQVYDSEDNYVDPAAVASRMNRAVSCGWSQCGKCPQSSKT